MSARHRVVIAESYTLVREGLRLLIETDPGLEVVAEAENGRDAVRRVGESSPDLILLDISMPGSSGVEALDEIKVRYPAVKILVLTVRVNDDYVQACIRSGANGYIVMDAGREEFMRAVRDVLQGRVYVCSRATEKMMGWLMHGTKVAAAAAPDSLTHREHQILRMIAEGEKTKAIAKFLSISPRTVEKHRASLMAKLDVRSSAGLVAFAIEKGIAESWSTAGRLLTVALLYGSDWGADLLLLPAAV
jgi:DNA-binding NarL/FixJ family response regulator